MTKIRDIRFARFLLTLVALVMAASCKLPAFAEPSDNFKYAEDEKVLRSQADQYAKAFASGDSKAIAAMWTQDAHYVDNDGNEYLGRDEIEKVYSQFFARMGGQPIDISIQSISFPADNVAIEEGITKLSKTLLSDSASRYTVVHLKENGQWHMSRVTETAYTPRSEPTSLTDLSWLIGDWSATDPKNMVHFKAKWVADKHFILCTYRPSVGEKESITDIELIGWDPLKKQIFSAHYSSSGGFGKANWSKNGQRLIQHAWAIQPDGKKAVAAYIINPIDNNSFTWQSTRRSINGINLPDSSLIKVTRDSPEG